MNKLFLINITFIATLGGLLFGYDTAVISGAIGPLESYFNLAPIEVGFAASAALLGCALGAVLAGWLSSFMGRRHTLMIAAVCFGISALMTAIPKTYVIFILFRALGGIGIGLASMVSPMYIAEVAPSKLRGRLVSLNQFAIVTGILIVFLVNYLIAQLGDQLWITNFGWRYMLASELIPAILFLILLFFIPESPRYLLIKKKFDKALEILIKINGPERGNFEFINIKKSLDQVQKNFHTPWSLITSKYNWVILVGIILSVAQQATGINVFMYYAPEIFKDLGSGAHSALWQTVLIGVVNLLATIFAIFTVDKWGRKPLIIIGCTGMSICLSVVGFGIYTNNISSWLIGYVLGYVAFFAMSLGPVIWVLLAEIFPNKIRSQALAIAVFFQWVANYVVSQTFPILNSNNLLNNIFHGAFPFWLYAFMCLLTIIFTYYCVPETKGKDLEEIEANWLEGANA